MATKITMPQLGESVTEGTISKWLVKAGDHVNKYDPICEVMTDKVNAEVPSAYTGKIKELIVAEDETVEVGALICYIEEENITTSINESKEASEKDTAIVANEQNDQSMKTRYSPAVLKLAQENNIDLSQVSGTGASGRITRKDLQQLIKSGKIPTPDQGAEASGVQGVAQETSGKTKQESTVAVDEKIIEVETVPPTKRAQLSVTPGDIELPVTGIRKAIASKMSQSKHEAPHAWTMVEVDVTKLVQFRQKVRDTFKQKEGINLTFFPFFIKAAVEALQEYPIINSHWAGDKIIQKKDINISIAVAREDNTLFTPVIKKADEKNIIGIARSVYELAQKARSGKLTTEDLQGGTFTVNNPGSFGSIESAPIINYPQAAIINVEAIVKRPVIIDGMIAIRDMVNICMSLDHRILDGLVCGRFLQSVKNKLEAMDEETNLY